ncbi:MAG: hypothetical protein Barrevirus9_2 [Barrevirus sp.]|uniref:Uncharacterized protein n=1 Tax=Barrevirus sp. TaxID=2487763 RepID=A0A3G4ZTW4_9VIRU|nr:MAG: hypothetical protein Barrevirus9_2 [Barrevirus sp.]
MRILLENSLEANYEEYSRLRNSNRFLTRTIYENQLPIIPSVPLQKPLQVPDRLSCRIIQKRQESERICHPISNFWIPLYLPPRPCYYVPQRIPYQTICHNPPIIHGYNNCYFYR